MLFYYTYWHNSGFYFKLPLMSVLKLHIKISIKDTVHFKLYSMTIIYLQIHNNNQLFLTH